MSTPAWWYAALSELDSPTRTPPEGAGASRVTVPVEAEPASTDAGFREIADRATPGGFKVRPAVRTVEPSVAVMVALVMTPTEDVVTVKVAAEDPAATVTDAGTVADPLELESATSIPPAGARPDSVTVPVDGEPPITLGGLRETEASSGGAVSVAFDLPDRSNQACPP
jgi:hypothetical protein